MEMKQFGFFVAMAISTAVYPLACANAFGDDLEVSSKAAAQSATSDSNSENETENKVPRNKDILGLTRLADEHDVWIDPMRRYVVVDGNVCLRRGTLEMLACPRGTKEHEAIVSLNSPAQIVHAALLAIGAKVGGTVKWDPKYVPASGTEIDIWILWKDKEGMNRKMRAQRWIRNIETGKAMKFPWVFAGSGFWTDEMGVRHYMANSGDLICVSNFSTATLDLPVKSSAEAGGLLFEAFTENIPTRGTHIRLVLIPKLEKKKKDSDGENPQSESATSEN